MAYCCIWLTLHYFICCVVTEGRQDFQGNGGFPYYITVLFYIRCNRCDMPVFQGKKKYKNDHCNYSINCCFVYSCNCPCFIYTIANNNRLKQPVIFYLVFKHIHIFFRDLRFYIYTFTPVLFFYYLPGFVYFINLSCFII